MSDVLMVAAPAFPEQSGAFGGRVEMLSIRELLSNECLYRAHTETLWRHFHTRGKYATIEAVTDWVVVALGPDGEYCGSLLVVDVPPMWLVHYVMVRPELRGRGVGTALMSCLMEEAVAHGPRWILLNCDPEKGLPGFYEKFGFRPVVEFL